MHGFPTLKESSTYLGEWIRTLTGQSATLSSFFCCWQILINDLWEAEREKNEEKRDILREKDAWARLKHNGSS